MRRQWWTVVIASLLATWPAASRAAELIGVLRWRAEPAQGWTCAPSPADVPGMPAVDMDPSIQSYCLGPAGEVGTVSVADVSDTSSTFDAETMLSSVAGSADPSWTLAKDKSGKTLNNSDYLSDERGRRAGSMTVAVVSGKGFSTMKGNVPTAVLKAQVPVHFRTTSKPPVFGQVIVVFDILARLGSGAPRSSGELTKLEGLTRNWAATVSVAPGQAVRLSPTEFTASRPEERGARDNYLLTPQASPDQCTLLWESSTGSANVYVDILVDGKPVVKDYATPRKGWYRWDPRDANSPCLRGGAHEVSIEVRASPGGQITGRSQQPVKIMGTASAPKVVKAEVRLLKDTHLVFIEVEPATADSVETARWEVCRIDKESCWDAWPYRNLGATYLDLRKEPLDPGVTYRVRASVGTGEKTKVEEMRVTVPGESR